jgi:hypothetical protein
MGLERLKAWVASKEDGHLENVVAFLCCAAALGLHLWDLLKSDSTSASLAASLGYVLPVAAALCLVILTKPLRNARGSLLVSVAFLASALSSVAQSPRWLHLVMLTVALPLILTFLRIGAVWYVLLAVFGGVLVGYTTDDPLIAVASAAGLGGLFFVTNYLVQLVIDHRYEGHLFWQNRAKLNIQKIAKLTMKFWLPSAALVGLGIGINSIIQDEIVNAIRSTGWIMVAPAESDNSGRSGLERDVFYTIDQREKIHLDAFATSLKKTQLSIDQKLAQFPKDVGDGIEAVRPKPINDAAACAGAVVSFKVLGKTITLGSFRGICQGIIRSIQAMIMSAFDRAKAAAVAKAEKETTALRERGKVTEAELQTLGASTIGDMYAKQRATAGAIFMLLLILSIVSYVMLVGALIGGFNLVFGRLLFGKDVVPRTPLMTFRLDPNEGDARALSFTSFDELDLTDGGKPTWFVCFQAMRIGTGTHMRLSLPQRTALFMQRLFTGRLLMTRVDVQYQGQKSVHFPTIAAPGDLKLVRFELDGMREIVFHISDMLAFSSDVKLKSIYTAHVAAHFLGLGSFYAVASGEGYIVLLSEGARVKRANEGLSLPPATLLAWDRRTEFALAQQVSFNGVWFNDPSVIPHSPYGAGVLDEGRGGAPGLFSRLWRIIRYLFMPF